MVWNYMKRFVCSRAIKQTVLETVVAIIFVLLLVVSFKSTALKPINQTILNISPKFEPLPEYDKPFLYLVQCKQCLAEYYRREDVIGGTGNHDVIVLSYDGLCLQNNQSHIKYITAPYNTTFGSGRNYLHNYSRNLIEKRYMYYIFLDEDVQVKNSGEFLARLGVSLDREGQKIIELPISPWRKFEQFLLDYQPPIGNVDRDQYYDYLVKSRRERLFPTYLFPGLAHDAMVNAFHSNLIDYIFPLELKHDNFSWWATVEVYTCRIFLRYHGQIVTFTPIHAVNKQHSSYPQGHLPLNKMCDDEINMAPLRIKNSTFVDSTFHKGKHSYFTTVSYFRYVVPRRYSSIKKYAIFPDEKGKVIFK